MLKVVEKGSSLSVCAVFVILAFTTLVFTFSSHAVNSANMNASITVDDSLTLNITRNGTAVSNITLSLDPASNPFAYQDLDIAVGTNNETGYQLTVTTPNDATNLVNTEDSSATIPTISTSGNYTASNFPVNQWGYKNGTSNNYIPFASNTIILQKDTRVNNDTTTLRFASRIDYTKKSGLYSTTLAFTVVANPVINYMQDMDPTLCTATPQIVVDRRDSKEYTVAKLKDGQCWMTSDLNLAGGTKLYSETSNVPAGYPESGGTGYFTLPASSSSGFNSSTTAYVYNTGNETTNQADCYSGHPCNSYYSWLAATAGGKDASGNAVTSDGYNAAYSICPKGWRLPTATTSNANPQTSPNWKTGDNYKLASAYGANLESNYYVDTATFYNNAGPGTTPNFLLANHYSDSAFSDEGAGLYWSSSLYPTTGDAYSLVFNSSRVISARSLPSKWGFLVRCLLNDTRTLSDITTMQDINPSIVANTANKATATLTDIRDTQQYSVIKINDKIWMTKNLAIGCNGSGNTYGDTRTSVALNSVSSDIINPAWTFSYTPDNTNDLTSSGASSDYTNPRIHCSNTQGAWYNYAYASASHITGSSNSVDALISVCPTGWKMPSNADMSGPVGSYTDFNLVTGSGAGFYRNGSLNSISQDWWTATSYSATARYILYWSGSGAPYTRGDDSRTDGFYIRCVAK